jgi:NAD(P)H-quinone oxidoreductase subunit 5
MLLAPGVLAVLVMIGGFTALFGGLVMLTQSAVKTSLAWSTVAQMGFMILQCGLALFPLALLHIVAHSLYKAHAFLASGRRWRPSRRSAGPAPWRSRTACGAALSIALVIYAVVVYGRGPCLRLRRQVAAGHRAGRHPDLRRRLPAGAGPGRRRAEGR